MHRCTPRTAPYAALDCAGALENMTANTVICEAIRKRALLEFRYHGKARVVAPYCFGVSTKGNDILRAIQVRGESSSGGLGLGKLWTVAEMVGLRMLDESFKPNDPNYNPNDSAMKQIHCRI
jgi:hypothetical protein